MHMWQTDLPLTHSKYIYNRQADCGVSFRFLLRSIYSKDITKILMNLNYTHESRIHDNLIKKANFLTGGFCIFSHRR